MVKKSQAEPTGGHRQRTCKDLFPRREGSDSAIVLRDPAQAVPSGLILRIVVLLVIGLGQAALIQTPLMMTD